MMLPLFQSDFDRKAAAFPSDVEIGAGVWRGRNLAKKYKDAPAKGGGSAQAFVTPARKLEEIGV